MVEKNLDGRQTELESRQTSIFFSDQLKRDNNKL